MVTFAVVSIFKAGLIHWFVGVGALGLTYATPALLVRSANGGGYKGLVPPCQGIKYKVERLGLGYWVHIIPWF